MIFSPNTVSVVLATHNGARYVEDQLKSIAAQTLPPFELVVADDASTDKTLEIVRHVSSRFAFPVTVRRNDIALGFRDNFLKASSLAKGRFLAFCDQDDVWHPNKLKRCSEFFQDKNVSLIVHAARLIDDKSKCIGLFKQGISGTRVKAPLSYDPWATFWGFSMVFRRELIELASLESRFIDFIVPTEQIAHDRWIMFLAQIVGSVAEIDENLVDYRQHSTNLFGAETTRKRSRQKDIIKRSEDYITATSQMLCVLDSLPSNTHNTFPLFDREKSRLFLESALRQLQTRHLIYRSPTRASAIRHLVECFTKRQYNAVHDGRLRWKSIMRDAQYALLRG